MADIVESDSEIELVSVNIYSQAEFDEELRQDPSAPGTTEDDPERLPRESQSFPGLQQPCTSQSGEAAKAAAKVRQDTEKDVQVAVETGDLSKAIGSYSEAMRTGGATALMLAHRAALLVRHKRPLAAIRDCTAALKINCSMVKAYRTRGTAHRKLGNWRKAQRDLYEAQALKFDVGIAEIQKFVSAQCLKVGLATDKKDGQALELEAPAAVPTFAWKPLEKGQAVTVVHLKNAPDLNGKRGVVERQDPRPASRGRWEIEVRLGGGRAAIKSLKRENIETLNHDNKALCKAWATEEKAHLEAAKELEAREEKEQFRKCVQAKMNKLNIAQFTRDMVDQLDAERAMDLLDIVAANVAKDEGANINELLLQKVKKLLENEPPEDSPPKKARLHL